MEAGDLYFLFSSYSASTFLFGFGATPIVSFFFQLLVSSLLVCVLSAFLAYTTICLLRSECLSRSLRGLARDPLWLGIIPTNYKGELLNGKGLLETIRDCQLLLLSQGVRL